MRAHRFTDILPIINYSIIISAIILSITVAAAVEVVKVIITLLKIIIIGIRISRSINGLKPIPKEI